MGVACPGGPLHESNEVGDVLVHPKVLRDVEPAFESHNSGGEQQGSGESCKLHRVEKPPRNHRVKYSKENPKSQDPKYRGSKWTLAKISGWSYGVNLISSESIGLSKLAGFGKR